MRHSTPPNILQGLTRLELRDMPTVRQALAHRPPGYANGWLYHLRASRNADGSAGFRFDRPGVFATIGFRRDFSTVVSPSGSQRWAAVTELCQSIARNRRGPVVVKKADTELYDQLRSTRGFHPLDRHHWLEDEAWPEHLVNLQELFLSCGELDPRARQLRRRYRRFQRQRNKLRTIEVAGNQMGDLLSRLRSMLKREPQKQLAYSAMCRFVQSRVANLRDFVMNAFICHRDRLHGLYLAECLRPGVAGLYCAVTSRCLRDSTEWMDVTFLKTLRGAGIQTVLLGGSETSGVHHYVQKLLPVAVNQPMRPLIYLPDSASRSGIGTQQSISQKW